MAVTVTVTQLDAPTIRGNPNTLRAYMNVLDRVAKLLGAAAERRHEPTDDTKAVSRTRIDRLCRRRDVPLREKTLWRMLYESASRASAVLALNIEDLDLPNKRARVVVKGGDTMWITWGTDTAHLLPRLIAGRTRGPVFLSAHRPGPHAGRRLSRATSARTPAGPGLATTEPGSCSASTAAACASTSSGTVAPPTSATRTPPPT
jgi:integrase